MPYGSYSPQRPGENTYAVTVIQPIDANHKRRVRIPASQRAKRVLDAQYTRRLRLEIDNLYTPFGFRNNTPTGGQDATSWSLGVMTSVPLLNRNQGNIRRAEINVSQTRTELAGVQRQIEAEVRTAFKDYDTASAAAQRLSHDVLPRAQGIRNRTLNLYKAGEEGAIGYLNAQREYSEVVRQYRDALIRQRRAALRLDTVVALRIVP